VTVTLDYYTLIKQLSGATLDYGQRLSAAQTRLAACDCKIIPVVMGGAGEPLDVGRAQRTVPLGIRRALVARDRGCRFPGCDRAHCIVSRPPHSGMESRRSHRRAELRAAVPHASPLGARHRMGHHHPRKPHRLPTTRHFRCQPKTITQPTSTLSPGHGNGATAAPG
jgi:hypothetical protein